MNATQLAPHLSPFHIRFAGRLLFTWAALSYKAFFIGVFGYWLSSSDEIERPLAIWLGETILGLNVPYVGMTGSGDGLYSYLEIFLVFLIALAINIVWCFYDRTGAKDAKMLRWCSVYLRYILISSAMSYGMVKVFPLQMSPPGTTQLMGEIGMMSPMGLAWRFVGTFTWYTFFAGFSEVLVALLLAFRRTATLGALLSVAVFGNVFMMNMVYDIPVKAYSLQLLVFSLWLVWMDWPSVRAFLSRNRLMPPRLETPLFQNRWLQRAALVFKISFLAMMVYTNTGPNYKRWKQGQTRPAGPIDGIWLVTQYEQNGEVSAPSTAEPERWHYLVFDHGGWAGSVIKMNGQVVRVFPRHNANKKTLRFRTWISHPRLKERSELMLQETPALAPFYELDVGPADYCLHDNGDMTLYLALDGVETTLTLQKIEREFLLMERGFHWVNPAPLLIR